jgi:tRNA threonylcarbamoyladenosine biosynthesis protein TsaB
MSQRWKKKNALDSGRRVLGLDCAGDHLSVALIHLPEDGSQPHVVHETTMHRRHRHADAILGVVHQVMERHALAVKDLSMIAVSRGPGGFTGVRVGMATAAGLAVGLQIPVWSVCSLRALTKPLAHIEGLLVPMLDAKKNEVYAAAYRWQDGRMEEIFGPVVASDQWVHERCQTLADGDPIRIFGNGAQAYGHGEELPIHWHVPSSASIALHASEEWSQAGYPNQGSELDPVYIRKSQAEEDAEKRHRAQA